MIRLDRRLHRRDVGRGGILVLDGLQTMIDVRRSVGAAGLREKLIRRDRRLMIDLRRDATCHLGVFGCALFMASAMEELSGITLVRLSKREIFARRRQRREVAMMLPGNTGEVLRMLE
jgi:hypothetical protein